MLPDPAWYYRDPSFLYPLRSHPVYWFCVGASQECQTIMGLLNAKFSLFVFDHSGEFLEIRNTELAFSRVAGGEPSLEELEVVFEAQVNRTRAELRLIDGCIYVKRFRLPELGVGIDDLPDELQEFVRGPSHLSRIEIDDEAETLELWKEEDLFLFWWGQSFTVNVEGEVVSS